MWDFLSKNCGIFSIEGGTKLWDFQHRGGDFCPLTSGHTAFAFALENSRKFHLDCIICSVLLKLYKKLEFYTSSDHESNQNEH